MIWGIYLQIQREYSRYMKSTAKYMTMVGIWKKCRNDPFLAKGQTFDHSMRTYVSECYAHFALERWKEEKINF